MNQSTGYLITPPALVNEFQPGDKIRSVMNVRAKLLPENTGEIIKSHVYVVAMVDGNHVWLRNKACAFHHSYFRSTKAHLPGKDREAAKAAIISIDKEIKGEEPKS